jgi:hypothetical protein
MKSEWCKRLALSHFIHTCTIHTKATLPSLPKWKNGWKFRDSRNPWNGATRESFIPWNFPAIQYMLCCNNMVLTSVEGADVGLTITTTECGNAVLSAEHTHRRFLYAEQLTYMLKTPHTTCTCDLWFVVAHVTFPRYRLRVQTNINITLMLCTQYV